jgi:hypothetical protein
LESAASGAIASDPQWEHIRKEWREGGSVPVVILDNDAVGKELERKVETGERFDKPLPLGAVVEWITEKWEKEERKEYPL